MIAVVIDDQKGAEHENVTRNRNCRADVQRDLEPDIGRRGPRLWQPLG